ncbi:hypothetical protein PF003_g32927 [Phytophthora fragariae]|nr:hypothetical protein PF003_g32927 [Phytophthora fragariae]
MSERSESPACGLTARVRSTRLQTQDLAVVYLPSGGDACEPQWA